MAVRFHRWATQRLHEHTVAELIYERVDSEKPFVGMTNFKGDYVIKDDVKIGKNYLSELELKRLNLLVSEFLDFAEFQALEEKPMKMKDWITALDNQIVAHQRKILELCIKLLVSYKPLILFRNIIIGKKAFDGHVQVVLFAKLSNCFHHWCGVMQINRLLIFPGVD